MPPSTTNEAIRQLIKGIFIAKFPSALHGRPTSHYKRYVLHLRHIHRWTQTSLRSLPRLRCSCELTLRQLMSRHARISALFGITLSWFWLIIGWEKNYAQ